MKSEIKVYIYNVKKFLVLNLLIKGGGSSIQNYLKQSVVDFLKEKSNIASNRLVKIKNSGTLVPARYLEENKTELYKIFPFSNQISKSTFFKYTNLNVEYKRPHR